jgi:WD40 repeat protein
MKGVVRLFAAAAGTATSGKVFFVVPCYNVAYRCTICRCWDLLSGLTVNIISDCGGEVTSVACSGHLLVTAARNSTVRVIDMRMNKVLQRLRGSHNVSRNFIRASFGPGSCNVMCGSEDGILHIWDPASGARVDKITASSSPVYAGAWSAAQGVLACACHDGTVPLWGQSQRVDFVASPGSPIRP